MSIPINDPTNATFSCEIARAVSRAPGATAKGGPADLPSPIGRSHPESGATIAHRAETRPGCRASIPRCGMGLHEVTVLTHRGVNGRRIMDAQKQGNRTGEENQCADPVG
jgi:hypothetical protein